jgi:hypothetical protein
MRNALRYALIAALAAAPFGPALAQPSTVYFSAPVRVGARALAFAGAIEGDNPDASVMYGNPAALAFLENSSIILTHSLERSSDVMDENVALPLYLRRGEVVGVAASVNHVGHLYRSSRSPFKVIQYGYDVAYSRRLTPTFSVGGVLNVRYARSSASRLWGLSSSLGFYYYPTPDVSYGVAVSGIGSGMKYIFDGTQTLLNAENIPRKLIAGAVLRFPSHVNQKPVLQVSLSTEKNFDIKGLFYYGGFELLPVEFLALRVGYLGGPDRFQYASYGVGFYAGGWKLDVGMTPSHVAGQVYQVGISVPIWNQMDKVY